MMCTRERGYNMTNSKTTKVKALRASDESFESIQQMAKENGIITDLSNEEKEVVIKLVNCFKNNNK